MRQTLIGTMIAMLSSTSEPSLGFLEVLHCTDSHLCEVSDSVLCLCQSLLTSLLRPEICLGVTLRQNAWGAYQIPSSESKAGFSVVLLRSNVVHVNAQTSVLRAAHSSVLVVDSELVGRRCITHLSSLSKKLTSVLGVEEEDIVDASLVEESQLMKRMRELWCSGVS
jgi:hypothetical protein